MRDQRNSTTPRARSIELRASRLMAVRWDPPRAAARRAETMSALAPRQDAAGVDMGRTATTPFEAGDGVHAEVRSLGQRFLGQTRRASVLAQQLTERSALSHAGGRAPFESAAAPSRTYATGSRSTLPIRRSRNAGRTRVAHARCGSRTSGRAETPVAVSATGEHVRRAWPGWRRQRADGR